MSTYSNWREDLIEVIDTPTTEAKALRKVKETKVKNKVVINPKLDEAVKELGGELLEVKEVDDKSGTGEDPQIKSKEKRQAMIKRQVLLKKLQAVRAGGGADITAGYEPDGEMIESTKHVVDGEKYLKLPKKYEKVAKHKGDYRSALGKAKDAITDKLGKTNTEKDGVKDSSKKLFTMQNGYEPEGEMVEGKGYQPEIEVIKSKDLKKKERESKLPPHLQGDAIGKMKKAFASEGVMKMVKRVIRGKKVERKPQKATDAGAVARRKLQQKDHETVNFLPMNESDKPEKDINKINEKKRKNALLIQKVIGEDKGYDYVLAKLKAKHGDGVLTKGDKIKPLTAAQKKKNAKIMAQRAKQDGRDATEKASDGRYNDRSRSD